MPNDSAILAIIHPDLGYKGYVLIPSNGDPFNMLDTLRRYLDMPEIHRPPIRRYDDIQQLVTLGTLLRLDYIYQASFDHNNIPDIVCLVGQHSQENSIFMSVDILPVLRATANAV